MSGRHIAASILLAATTVVSSACAAPPRGSVAVGEVVVEPSHGCRIGITATFNASTSDAITGVVTPISTVSLHPLVGGPAVGGHEGHLDNDGKRATRPVTSIALVKGTTTLRAHDLALMVDGGTAVLGTRPEITVTFRFRNSDDVTITAPVHLASCG